MTKICTKCKQELSIDNFCKDKLSDPEQQKACFHYTNLQPLWWWQNIRKSDNDTWHSIGELFNVA